MRFALNSDHKDFYSKNGFVEFENLIAPDSLASLQKEIDETLSSRLKTFSSRLADQPKTALFEKGFDLWRENSAIKKALTRITFSDIASELFQTPFLRIGFDQYIDTGSGAERPLTDPLSLNQMSCANPLVGALIISFSEQSVDPQICPIPSQPGRGIFLSADKVIPWDQLFSQHSVRLLLFAYAAKKTFYRLEKNDPHTHVWKGLGYVFGDLLNDHLHPVLHRA
jgi:hypothetical protein